MILSLFCLTETANYNLGVVHYQQQNTNQAISTFLHSLTLSPSPTPTSSDSPSSPSPLTPAQILTTDTHTNLGSLYILSKPPRPDLALYHLQEALGIMPDDGEICFNLGAVLEASGEVEEAVSLRFALNGRKLVMLRLRLMIIL